MERLYCPECGDYLEGGDGSMVDCHCGWKQERSIASDEEELETLRQRVAELEATCVDHGEIQKALCDRVAELEKERDRLSELCDKWNFECDDMREDNNRLANVADALKQQRDELVAAAEAIEIDAEECLDFDECTAMLVPTDTYHKLMEAIASVKGK